MKTFKEFCKHGILFVIGGFIYVAIELLYRGHSHWTMFIVGGLCFLFIGGINNWIPWKLPMPIQGLIGLGIILCLEFIAGVIVNIILKWNVWDYSNMPLNILGQVCLPFALLWFPLALVAIVLDDYLRYWMFGEQKPEYYIWFNVK